MPTILVSFFGFVQANYGQITAAVLMLTLFGSFLNWCAKLLANVGWLKSAQLLVSGASLVGDLVKAIGYFLSLLFSLFGKTPPPMTRRMTRGPFDNYADGGVAVLGKKSPTSSRTRLGAFAWAGIFLGAYFFVSFFVMRTAHVKDTASWDSPTPGVLEGCGGTLQPAAGPSADAMSCGAGYITETVLLDETPTIQGFEDKCASKIVGDLATIGLQIFESLMSSYALTPPPNDAGKMKALGPNPFLEHATALRNAYAAKVGAK